MIAQCNRFYGAVRILKSYIDNGEMGKAYGAEFYREGGDIEPMGYNNWFRDEALSGGAIQDLHVHDTDMVNFLFGMPKAVSTIGVNRIPGAGFDALSTNYVYDDKIVSARCDWTIAHDKFNTRSIRINFEKGYIIKNDNFFVMVDENDEVIGYVMFSKIHLNGKYLDELLILNPVTSS